MSFEVHSIEFTGGDWLCSSCGNKNKRRREKCKVPGCFGTRP